MNLTNEQINFLNQHGIPFSKVFNATGLRKAEYSVIMKSIGASIAVGVTPCNGIGHSMRNHSGHCVMCNPSYLAYRNRYEEVAQIYVATAKRSNLTKIGIAKDAHERLKNINSYGYGGFYDWEIKFVKTVKNAGRVEAESQKIIGHKRCNLSYERDGENVDCREIFKCDASLAILTVKHLISIHG